MQLDAGLISQFIKATNDDKPVKSEKTVYGTVVVYDGKKYVKMDGSELLTPIAATTKVEDKERVMVMVKNHTATVTGNLTSPSARDIDVETLGTKISEFEIIIADKVDTIELNAVSGRIDDLQSDFVTVKDSLTAVNADIKNLEADNVEIKDSLTAAEAEIDDLEARNVTITGRLDAADADIDSLQADNVVIRKDLTAQNATITNLQSDHAEFKTATAGRLDATEADIKSLETDKLNANEADIKYATITNLDAANAKITNLESTFGDFKVVTTDKIAANEASIEELETTKLSASDIEGKYANIDFSNIGEAAMRYLYAESGLIENVVINNGTITGNLVGVTIKGDLIEGGTVKANKLVILGTDGLYYKLNTNGVTTEAEQTEYNSINGSIITAQSITANKVDVDDLVAFDATIGGFNITSSAIYSGVKTTVNNTTRGIYLDNTGQIAAGDASNYIKYYKDTDGTYKLVVSADNITLSTGKSMSTIVEEVAAAQNTANDAVNRVGAAETAIEQNASDITDLEKDVETAQTTADNAITRISSAETNIQQNTDQIGLMATKTEVTESLSGYYTKSQADAAIKLSADNITSTVESTYAKQTDLDSVENRVDSAESSISQNSESITSLVSRTDRVENKFNEYSTTTEMTSAIKQSADNITSTVESTYAKQTDLDSVENRVDSAESSISQNSESITSLVSRTSSVENKFSDYPTTTEMTTAIEQASNTITLEVSQTYATQTDLAATDEKIDSLEIGGRNYLLNSTNFTSYGTLPPESPALTASIVDGVIVVSISEAVSPNWHKLSSSLTTDSAIEESFKTGDEFTFSIEIKCDSGSTGKPQVYFKEGLGYYHMIGTVSTDYSTIYYTGLWDDTNSISMHVRWQNCTGTFYIRKMKFERGTKPTDWTPAQEEIDENIDNALYSANTAKHTADTNASLLSRALIEIDSLKNTISTLVTGQNGESLMIQTENGWQFNMKTILDTLNTNTQNIGVLTDNMENNSNKIEVLDQAVLDLGEYTDYIQFGVMDGRPCILLGEIDSSFKVIIKNTGIDFMEGGQTPLTLNQQSVKMKSAVIEKDLRQGRFVWEERANGNYGLSWRG